MSSAVQEKLPFKRVEIPLSKFNEIAIPYHSVLLLKHKQSIQKYQFEEDWDHVRAEQNNAARLVKQLKQLVYEMDILRSQVRESDLAKFDKCTEASRQTVNKVVNDYLVVIKKIQDSRVTPAYDEDPTDQDPDMPTGIMRQIQRLENEIEADENQRREACLRSAEKLQTDLEDLHSAFVQLSELVHEQGELVDTVEDHVESAAENVEAGTQQLARAVRYRTAIYPVTGALMGTCLGGPIGLLAGLKLGGLAAIGCGISGYLGGKFLKEKTDDMPVVDTEEEAGQSTEANQKSKVS